MTTVSRQVTADSTGVGVPEGAPGLSVGAPVAIAVGSTDEAHRRRGWIRSALRFARDEPFVVFGLLILVVVAVFAIAPGLVATASPTASDIAHVREAPSGAHWFGTDQIGRDLFSRVVYGTRISVTVGIAATLIAAVIGCTIGLLAGYVGGFVDSLLMRAIDVMLAFPGILLALAILAVRGPGLTNMLIAIGIAGIPGYARVIRGQVISVRARPFVEAAISTGATRRRLVLRHVLPNALTPVIVLATVGIGFAILAGASLSFLGMGPRPPSPEWGAILSDGRGYLSDSWWIAVFPGIAILLTVLAVNIVGQWLRERLDRRNR